jgi:hypothetical protein
MFDASTGILSFERPAVVISPAMTRAAFLASPLAEGATSHIKNEPFHSWKLKGSYRSAQLDLLVVVWFRDEKLTMISLMDPDSRYGTSWEDYSLEKEMKRKASHDAWLSRVLPSQTDYSWGSVRSDYNDRGAFSEIVVKYGGD